MGALLGFLRTLMVVGYSEVSRPQRAPWAFPSGCAAVGACRDLTGLSRKSLGNHMAGAALFRQGMRVGALVTQPLQTLGV